LAFVNLCVKFFSWGKNFGGGGGGDNGLSYPSCTCSTSHTNLDVM